MKLKRNPGTANPPPPPPIAPSWVEAHTPHHPPAAPLVLRIGVTGHRPDPESDRPAPDVAKIRTTVGAILRHIDDAAHGVAQAHPELFDLRHSTAHPGRSGALRIISALAEGSDQWVADEALKLGYELQCPLPFPRGEYGNDFGDPAVKAEFRRLLDQATAVLEMDGQVDRDATGARKPDGAADEAVGRALLNQTDLLLAIWDGLHAQGRGGPGNMVREALQRGIPVVWVSWSSPETWVLRLPEWRLVQKPADLQGDAERLREQVRNLLLPPSQPETDERGRATTLHSDYFAETQKSGNLLHGCWQIFLGVISGTIFRLRGIRELLALKPFRVPQFREATLADWKRESAGTILDCDQPSKFASALPKEVQDCYLDHYAWANRLSMYYATLYRSAFVASYFMAVAAAFVALIPVAIHLTKLSTSLLTGLELVTISMILFLILPGRHKHWHERWIDYRTLAERLRLARCLALMGGGGQQVSLAGHLATYGNPAATWMHWHYLAIERAAGLRSVSFTEKYLRSTREFWQKKLVEGQIEYHVKNRARYEMIDRRLHRAVVGLLVATLGVCAIHFLPHVRGGWPTLLSAFLPALGAALVGIRGQAEAQRLARRSYAMVKSLERLRDELADVPTRPGEGNSQRLRLGVDRVTDLMIQEMLDWRVVLTDRPLEIHI